MKDLTYTKREPAGSTVAEKIRDAVAKVHGVQGGRPAQDCALVLDISGSMNEYLGANRRKIDELRTLAGGFRDIRRFEFGSTCREIQAKDEVGDPWGGTAMDIALLTVKGKGITHVVMITDGLPDDEDRTLDAARGMRIDCFYVGPDPAPEFLRKLCKRTGGGFNQATLRARKELESKVRALIAAPEDGRKGPILL